MKFVYGDIPSGDKFFEKDSIWKKANMDKIYNIYNKRLTLMSIFSLLLSFGLGIVFYTYHEEVKLGLKYFVISFPITLVLLFPIHNFFQVLFLPEGFKKSYIGLNLKGFSTFLFLDRSVTKSTLIFTLILPFILFSVIPLCIVLYLGGNSIVYSIFYGGLMYSTFDLLKIYALLKYIPKKTLIRCYGYDIYYKHYGFTTPKNDKNNRNTSISSKDKEIRVSKSTLK